MSWPLIYIIIAAAVTAVYVGSLVGFVIGLHALKRNHRQIFSLWPSVSVIVPARNEAEVLEHTLASLFEQDYPGAWEIVVVDDRSTDQTPVILDRIAKQTERLRIVTITEPDPPSPKKNALSRGIEASQGEIIVTTDADCQYKPGWLRSLVSHMTPDTGVVAGLTVFDLPVPKVPVWQKVQWLDFFVQNFLAAGAAGAGIPSSCNGSNLAFRREVFQEISGYGDKARIISGDDVLFTQRVSRLTEWKIVFSADADSTVRSLPITTVRDLIQQRLRWASKGLTYRKSMLTFLLGIYTYYLLLLSIPLMTILFPEILVFSALIVGGKLTADYLVVRKGAGVFKQESLLKYFPLYIAVQTLAAPCFGIAGLLLPYRWKGDWYRTARLPAGVRRRLVKTQQSVQRARRIRQTQ